MQPAQQFGAVCSWVPFIRARLSWLMHYYAYVFFSGAAGCNVGRWHLQIRIYVRDSFFFFLNALSLKKRRWKHYRILLSLSLQINIDKWCRGSDFEFCGFKFVQIPGQHPVRWHWWLLCDWRKQVYPRHPWVFWSDQILSVWNWRGIKYFWASWFSWFNFFFLILFLVGHSLTGLS